MERYPHDLRRSGRFAHAWELRGPLLRGQVEPARRGAHGVIQLDELRLLYHVEPGRHQELTFHSPRLAKGGDRIEGRITLQGPDRGLEIRSRGTGPEGVHMTVEKAGLFGKKLVLVDPAGRILASVRRNGRVIDVDIPARPFEEARRKEDEGKRGRLRVLEASVAMLLAARIEQHVGRVHAHQAAAAKGAAAGAAAGAAMGVGAAAYRRAKRRKEA